MGEEERKRQLIDYKSMTKKQLISEIEFWRNRTTFLEEHLLEISSIPSDSWGWRNLRTYTARKILGVDENGEPIYETK